MDKENLQLQILHYFQKNFIENKTGTADTLADVIREKLVLLDSSQEKKNLIQNVLDNIKEQMLIAKYQKIYQHPTLTSDKQIITNNLLHQLNYNFSNII